MNQELPFFSIIIPTYARPNQLATCLESLTKLNYPSDRFEVIVVNDGSEMPLDQFITPFSNQLDITLITQSHAGPATARNTGAASSKGEFLAFTDDDCRPTTNWLQNLASSFAKTPHALIGGQTLNQLTGNVYSTASQVLTDYLYACYNREEDNARFFASNNLALPAKLFDEIGGFDTSYPLAAGEDRDFCARILDHGYKMIYSKQAQVYHAHELTLSKFWRQHFNYGRGAFCFRKNRAKASGRIKVEALSFYFYLLAYPLSSSGLQSVQNKFFAPLICGLLAVSQIANITGFFWQRTQTIQNYQLEIQN